MICVVLGASLTVVSGNPIASDTLVQTYEQCQAVMLIAKQYQYNLICLQFPKSAEVGAENATVRTYEQCQADMRTAKEYQYDLICPQFPKSEATESTAAPKGVLPAVAPVKTYDQCQSVMLSAKEYQYNLICPQFPKSEKGTAPANVDSESRPAAGTLPKVAPVKTYEECQSVMRAAKEYLYNLMCPLFPKSS